MNPSPDPSALWKNAGKNLGFEIVAPFRFRVEGREHDCIAFLPHFGGPNGMVLFCIKKDLEEETVELNDACALRYYASWLNIERESFLGESRDYFIEALSDWGYYGPEDRRPKWFANWWENEK